MATDIEIVKQRMVGQAQTFGLSTSPTTAVIDAIDTLADFVVFFDKASDDAMASTATSETYTGIYLPVKCKLLSCTYLATTGGITADASNNATITVSSRDSAAANQATIASATTNVAFGNVTQGAGKALTVSTSNFIVAAGSTVTFTIAKGGTGVVVRAGRFTLRFTKV